MAFSSFSTANQDLMGNDTTEDSAEMHESTTEMWKMNAFTYTEYSISQDDIHIEFDNSKQANEEGSSNSAIEGSSGVAVAEQEQEQEQEQEVQVVRRRRIGIVDATDKDITRRRNARVLRKKFGADNLAKN